MTPAHAEAAHAALTSLAATGIPAVLDALAESRGFMASLATRLADTTAAERRTHSLRTLSLVAARSLPGDLWAHQRVVNVAETPGLLATLVSRAASPHATAAAATSTTTNTLYIRCPALFFNTQVKLLSDTGLAAAARAQLLTIAATGYGPRRLLIGTVGIVAALCAPAGADEERSLALVAALAAEAAQFWPADATGKDYGTHCSNR